MGLVLAELPALPLHEAGKYVAAAYVVLFAMVLIYVTIMAIRLSHIQRELGELLELTRREEEAAAIDGPAAAGVDRESSLAYPVERHPPFREAGK
ncbi:MAG: hypothetical protein ACLQBB_10675 [Solirubrobacteraceae bacterium]